MFFTSPERACAHHLRGLRTDRAISDEKSMTVELYCKFLLIYIKRLLVVCFSLLVRCCCLCLLLLNLSESFQTSSWGPGGSWGFILHFIPNTPGEENESLLRVKC